MGRGGQSGDPKMRDNIESENKLLNLLKFCCGFLSNQN